MHETLRGVDRDRLERSCGRGENRIRLGAGAAGIQRAEVRLTASFARHRHDTYAIGITTAGVQRFWYRGERRTCLPGQLHVLHPDETHDGGPGTAEGFAYRILYIDPALVRAALGDGPLPFVHEPVHDQTPRTREVRLLLEALDDPVSDLGLHDAAVGIADALIALGGRAPEEGPLDLAALNLVRDYLVAHACEPTPAPALEQISGLSRYTLARQFRRAYGTSPDRFRTMRRLELARAGIQAGLPLATVAAEAGFADQSHMTRQFTRAYGMTPGRWAAAAMASSA
jgi:AraC-like DNA-binding protein/quercetin dioxygenase-like cupin family protein